MTLMPGQRCYRDAHVRWASVRLFRWRLWRCTASSTNALLVDSTLAAARPVHHDILGWNRLPGHVWERCLDIKDNSLETKLTFAQGLPDDHVNDLAMLDVHVAWWWQRTRCGGRFGRRRRRGVRRGPRSADNLIMAVAVAANGSVLAGTDGAGVFAWEPEQRRAYPLLSSWVYGHHPISRWWTRKGPG